MTLPLRRGPESTTPHSQSPLYSSFRKPKSQTRRSDDPFSSPLRCNQLYSKGRRRDSDQPAMKGRLLLRSILIAGGTARHRCCEGSGCPLLLPLRCLFAAASANSIGVRFGTPNLAPSTSSTLSLGRPLGGQKRGMFIQTQTTPNPSSLMFYPGKPVMEVGSADFPNARTAMSSPLAKSLFGIDGIIRVFFGSDFVTVTKTEEASWVLLKPEIFSAIMDFYSSAKPLFLDSNVAASMDTAIQEDDSEVVAMIKELLETRIRPSVQDDGGDIEYRGYDPGTGIVKLRMQGACSGCPSSSVTLKSGIENMLMHYLPEVRGVEQELDNEEDETLTSQMD